MKVFALIITLLIVVSGAWMVYQGTSSRSEDEAIKQFIKSRGAAPIPSTWRGKIGSGI
jgi:hypothetical protein